MSVPSDKLMELMKKGQESQGQKPLEPSPPQSISDAETPPMSSPMSTPEPKMGSKEGAMINIGMALDLIEESLPALGSDSEEGEKALNSIRTLSGLLGPRKNKTNELQQSEILQMLQTLPQAGGMSPEAKAEGYGRCRMEVEPAGEAAKLTITHWSEVENSRMIAAVSGGWPQIVSNLKSLLETGKVVLTGF